jgi:hypothetical protein
MSRALRTSMRRTPAGVGRATGHQGHFGACLGSGTCHRESHLARRQVGEAAHRVDRLVGRPRGHEHLAPGEHLGLELRDHRVAQLRRLEHATVADLAAGLVAGCGPEQRRPVAHDLRDVAVRGGVGPHLAVHRRGHEQRAALDGARQAQQRKQFVGVALRQLGDEVRARGGHDHRVGLACQVDVRHLVGRARIPLARVDGPAGKRLHRHCGNEVLGRLSHHHLHGGARARELAREFGRLVAGDAAGEPEHEVLAGEVETIAHGARL